MAFGGGATLAFVITLAISVHNIPEGLAISAVLRPRGTRLLACAGWSIYSSLPQPLMAVPAFLFVETFRKALPYGLGFAAGAMVFMVLEELLPQAYDRAPRTLVALQVSLTLITMVLFQRLLWRPTRPPRLPSAAPLPRSRALGTLPPPLGTARRPGPSTRRGV